MCFSASASFVTSGGLAVVAAATTSVAPKKKRFLALIPAAFAIQQALEGIQWLSLQKDSVCTVAGYGFTFFAFLFWPVCIPLFVYLIDRASRSRVRWFLGLGIGVALANLLMLLQHSLSITTTSGSIVYSAGITWTYAVIITILYVVSICGPLAISRIREFRWFGLLVFLSAATAHLWYAQAFTSVWCFFAAILSGLVFLYARNTH